MIKNEDIKMLEVLLAQYKQLVKKNKTLSTFDVQETIAYSERAIENLTACYYEQVTSYINKD